MKYKLSLDEMKKKTVRPSEKMIYNKNKIYLFTDLELSPTFYTIDHSFLIKRLEGIYSEQCLSGLSLTYLPDIDRLKEAIPILNYANPIPQGSVLGTLPFTLYMQPLVNIIEQHSISMLMILSCMTCVKLKTYLI